LDSRSAEQSGRDLHTPTVELFGAEGLDDPDPSSQANDRAFAERDGAHASTIDERTIGTIQIT
jgi:hypothetical protein